MKATALVPSVGADTVAAATAEDISGGLGGDDALQDFKEKTDLWVNAIFPFLGPGHYLYVALVNKQFKENYIAYSGKIAPIVQTATGGRRAAATKTFYFAAFFSAPCAKFWDEETMGGNTRLDDDEVSYTIAKHGNLQTLQWALGRGFPWNRWKCEQAAKNGKLEILKWARENDCPDWDKNICEMAAANGHLEILKWARQNDCPWNGRTCADAAYGGHLEVLKWARKNGCSWDELTCTRAAYRGHLEVLKWARANDCPWNEDTCEEAVRGGHLAVLQWAHENGCPWEEPHVRRLAEKYKYQEILDWLNEVNQEDGA